MKLRKPAPSRSFCASRPRDATRRMTRPAFISPRFDLNSKLKGHGPQSSMQTFQTMPERGPECRPSAGHSVPQCPQCRPVPAYGRALRAPVSAFGRHSVPPMRASAGLQAFGRHSVPPVQTSAGLASVSPMPRVTECPCRPVLHCRCRPSGPHQALVTYRV